MQRGRIIVTPAAGEIVAIAKAEFESSAQLRAEFLDLEIYTAWRKAAAAQQFRVFGAVNNGGLNADTKRRQARMSETSESLLEPRPPRPEPTAAHPSGPIDQVAKAEWEASPEIRAEFLDLKTYTAWRKADAAGLGKMYGL